MSLVTTDSFTQKWVDQPHQKVTESWANSSDKGIKRFAKRQGGARLAFVALGVLSVLTSTLDAAAQLYLGVVGLPFAGKFILDAETYGKGTKKFLPNLFRSAITTINPKAEVHGDGGFTGRVQDYAKENLEKWSQEDQGFFKREIATRFGYALTLVVSAVLRAVDGVLGCGGALLAALTLGSQPLWNKVAYGGLQITGIISDIVLLGTRIINPQAGLKIAEKIKKFSEQEKVLTKKEKDLAAKEKELSAKETSLAAQKEKLVAKEASVNHRMRSWNNAFRGARVSARRLEKLADMRLGIANKLVRILEKKEKSINEIGITEGQKEREESITSTGTTGPLSQTFQSEATPTSTLKED